MVAGTALLEGLCVDGGYAALRRGDKAVDEVFVLVEGDAISAMRPAGDVAVRGAVEDDAPTVAEGKELKESSVCDELFYKCIRGVVCFPEGGIGGLYRVAGSEERDAYVFMYAVCLDGVYVNPEIVVTLSRYGELDGSFCRGC